LLLCQPARPLPARLIPSPSSADPRRRIWSSSRRRAWWWRRGGAGSPTRQGCGRSCDCGPPSRSPLGGLAVHDAVERAWRGRAGVADLLAVGGGPLLPGRRLVRARRRRSALPPPLRRVLADGRAQAGGRSRWVGMRREARGGGTRDADGRSILLHRSCLRLRRQRPLPAPARRPGAEHSSPARLRIETTGGASKGTRQLWSGGRGRCGASRRLWIPPDMKEWRGDGKIP
jgi:hypothetical protein